MSFTKILSTSLFGLSISSLSMFAYADLTITNNTSQYSTAVINNVLCSSNSVLGEKGITKPHSTNPVPNVVIWFACHATPKNCKADVYMSKNCGASGSPKIATIVFDTTIGIKSITMYSNDYRFTGAGFVIQMDGGPAFDAESFGYNQKLVDAVYPQKKF